MRAAATVRFSALPLALTSFAAGVVLLQWQPELSPAVPWLVASLAIAGVALALGVSGLCLPGKRVVVAALVATTAGVLGFCYGTWRATERLNDALPPEWEGIDVAIVGVVDELPQTSPRSSRFAFAVERSETPNAVVPSRQSLAW